MDAIIQDYNTAKLRTTPSNVQAEQMLLGSILINIDLLNKVSDFLKPNHFFELLHQKIYSAITALTEKGLIATPITLKNMLDKDQLFIDSGSEKYLNRLISMSMIVINPHDYGTIIYELALKRQLINLGEEVVNIAYESTLEQSAMQQIEAAESKLYHLASEGLNEKSFFKISNSIADSLVKINRAMKSSSKVIGISSGLMDLDTKLSGFHNSDLIIIAARPSMGKTAFALNLAFNTCNALQNKLQTDDNNNKVPSVGFFSLEMSSEQLATRLMSMMTNIDSAALRAGMIREENYNKLCQTASKLSEMPIFIDDTPALSISSIRTRARRLKRTHNLAILFIDYLQLIKSNSKHDNRVMEISEITQGLKAIAKELDIPVVALSQLSRAVEQREDKKPMLSDLRESGSIEQDADVVMFIYREEYYLTRKEPTAGDKNHHEWQQRLGEVHNLAEILIAKHRNGPIGNVFLFYDNQHSKFDNLQK